MVGNVLSVLCALRLVGRGKFISESYFSEYGIHVRTSFRLTG